MKNTRILALLTAVTLLATAMSACAPKADPGKTDATTESKKDATTQDTPAKGDAPTLVWYQIGQAPENLAAGIEHMNKYTMDKINAKVDIKFLDWGVWADKIKTIVSTGENFDLMFTNGDYYTSHVNMGAFTDLTDLIDKDAPKLREAIPESLWKAVEVKGKVYSVPTYKDSSQRQYWAWDKEMVDKYKVDYENIKTLKELDPVLRKIKEGEGKSFYPFILNGDGVNGQFMYFDNNVRYDDKTGKAIDSLERPELVDMWSQLHAWYKDGIINPDAPTMTELPKVRTVFSAQGFPGANVTWSTNMGKEVVSTPWSPAIYTTGTITGSVNVISSNSKNVSTALKVLELANTDSTYRNMLAYGIEGENFKVLENKTIEKLNEAWTAPAYCQATFFNMFPVAPNPPDQWEMVKKQNEEAESSVLLGFVFDPTNVEAEQTALAAIDQKYKAELYTGAKDPKTILPKYIADKKAAGSDKVLAEYQKQIDTFLGK